MKSQNYTIRKINQSFNYKMMMEKIIAVCIVLYALCVVIYFAFEKQFVRKQMLPPPENPDVVDYTPIVGKSLYNMGQSKPQAATVQDVEPTVNKESIFVPETRKEYPVQVPEEELEKAFSEEDNRVTDIDVPLEYENETEQDTGAFTVRPGSSFATGFRIEEISEAINIAKTRQATDEQKQQAGKTFFQIEGNSIYNQLIANDENRKQEINELMNFYLDRKMRESTKSANKLEFPETVEEFDVQSVL